jgi:hypothetical protein
MDYRHTPPGANYAPYAAGTVFYAARGHTAFPVRLAVEIYRRCLALRAAGGHTAPAVVYDPTCGSAYHLAALAYFNWDAIAAIHASDLDPDALGLAARNLSLLTVEGLDRRIAQLAALHGEYAKPSHAAALAHAATFRAALVAQVARHPLPTHLFRADATHPAAVAGGLAGVKPDIVFADIPYGQLAAWHPATAALGRGEDPLQGLLAALRPNLAPGAVVAVAAPKHARSVPPGWAQAARLRAGTRAITLLRCAPV